MNENPHQAGKENYTPNGHTQTLLIFYRAHSKLYHTLTFIYNIYYKKIREIFVDDDFLYSFLSCVFIDASQQKRASPFIGRGYKDTAG